MIVSEYDRSRFNSKYIPEPMSGCWIWEGGLDTNGYGKFSIGDKYYIAHRISYSIYKEENIEGLCVCHTCDNRWCVNPSHLFLGTQEDNLRDMWRKNRGYRWAGKRKGEQNPNSKLKEEDIPHIHKMLKEGRSNKEISDLYKVSSATISSIKSGGRWNE